MMGVTIEKRQIAYNITARYTPPKFIVVHDTGNKGSGADANAHFNFFNTGNRNSSADVFVDDKRAIQVNDFDKYYTWHCGDGRGKYGITNANSIGIEMCVNSDGDYERAFENTIEVVRHYMKLLGIDADHVVRHYDASRKNCPQSFNVNGWARWTEFKRRLAEANNESEETEEMRYDYIDENMPAWARPTVQKLCDNGILKGGDGGKLDLSMDMIRMLVILDRAGVF